MKNDQSADVATAPNIPQTCLSVCTSHVRSLCILGSNLRWLAKEVQGCQEKVIRCLAQQTRAIVQHIDWLTICPRAYWYCLALHPLLPDHDQECDCV
jgi:hypothetical protein